MHCRSPCCPQLSPTLDTPNFPVCRYRQYSDPLVTCVRSAYLLLAVMTLLPSMLQQTLPRCHHLGVWWWLRATGAEHLLILPLGCRVSAQCVLRAEHRVPQVCCLSCTEQLSFLAPGF